MWVIDISNPAKPRRVLLFDTDGPALAAVLSSDIVYILEGDSDSSSNARFRVVDLSVPDSPVDLASFGYRSMTMDMAAADGVQYIASGDTGLYVRDDSDPEESLDGFLDTPGLALGVTLRAGFALVADGHKGLRIVDVADASNMAEIGFIDTPGEARRVAAGGDYAYVADGDGGLRIIDVSVPEIPVEVAAVETTEPALDVVVWADSAYVVAGDEVEIIDVSDPTAPVKASTPALRGSVVAVADSLLYVGIGGSFHIWDVADPWDPILLVEDFIGTAVKDIELSAEHAYVAIQDGMAQSRGGVMILNVVDPYHPTFVGRWYGEWPSGGEVRAVAVSDGLIYLATGKDGVHVLDARCLTTYWVGIVAHSDGAAGSRWRSDVIIRHEAEHDVDIAFILHTQHGDITAEGSIGPRSQGVFEDVVGLFGHEGKGALEIQAGVPVNILSRVYNETDSGTSGAYFPGYRSSDCLKSGETVWLYGLRQMRGEYRTNINITNTGAEPGRVRITLYGCDGKRLMEYPVDVDPGKVVQELQPFWKRRGLCCIGWGFASVSVESGAVLVSATVIDSRTNHAMMVPMTR
jgi:hypothetical protein